MPRNLRYPFSPVQEIFLPEQLPFTAFNQSLPTQSSPPPLLAVPPSPSDLSVAAADCLSLQSLAFEKTSQLGSAASSSSLHQPTEAYRKYQQSLRKFACMEVRAGDQEWLQMRARLGPSGVISSPRSRDRRLDLLEATTTSIRSTRQTAASRYGL
eukprot:GHVS01096705.1.p1 GENE.GHVS01096705.1~~GHVS01096705.1.p1  ORF type:complete len:180 (-),score=41.84 GHVS01096705.1:299-763(-)